MENYHNSWEGHDPNSANQEWALWTLEIQSPKDISFEEVKLNSARWARLVFGTVGQMKVEETYSTNKKSNGKWWRLWRIEVAVEDRPVIDKEYVNSIKKSFSSFVNKGFGSLAIWGVQVKTLAGEVGDGPRSQLVVMPTIIRGDFYI